ncbi:hypothetical protein P9112_012346 [Eukaryota sp. TZLM1-RC]
MFPPTGSLRADRAFARVNADVIGPPPADQEGYQYILVFIDSFSRFTIIVPLKNANLTAYALIWKVCAIFGMSCQIHSDNGPEFSKAVFDELSKFSGIEVLKASGSSAKLHGDYLRPFLITEILFDSSVNIKYLCTGTIVQASVKHLAPWHSSLPANDEFHSWVAAGDVEVHIIEKVLSQDGDFCQVQWPGKQITTEHISTVQNTATYKDFLKTSKACNRTKPAPHKKRSNISTSPPVTRASRAPPSKEKKAVLVLNSIYS